jgi:GNAT superfamily N-acetyltransferase
MVRIERFDDVRSFYEAVAPYLERNEAAHTLHLGMRHRLERDPHVFGPGDPCLYAVLHGDEVAGIATQTPPFPLALSLFVDDVDADALADRLADDGLDLGGLTGPVGAARRFVDRWRELRGCTAEVELDERIYEVSEVIPPRLVSGHARLYEERDRDLVVAWVDAFIAEANPAGPVNNGAAFVARRALDPSSAMLLWDDGGPVSFAAYGSASPNGMRVGPVYTPPELRGRGYASAVTAAATERILAGGKRFAFLFTDLSNPTSNSIYQQLGYRSVTDITAWRFA